MLTHVGTTKIETERLIFSQSYRKMWTSLWRYTERFFYEDGQYVDRLYYSILKNEFVSR